MDDYLKKLEMKVDIHQMQPRELERVVQLCNKTNQFNLTTKRYTASDIINMDAKIYVVYTEDKYGKQGMVGVIILKQEDKAITIDTFLMSCRVMGRQLENVILYELSEYYRNLAERFLGCYIPTEKNKPVEFLYDKLGFQLTEDDGHKNYEWLLGGKMKKTDCYSEISFNPE